MNCPECDQPGGCNEGGVTIVKIVVGLNANNRSLNY
ncbi:MAG: hypothetical protein CM1200mP1_03540 [Candidatus Neomarinimicrobiota bacterium]|nr:MAG: hypothetical protein CM1200mP1_03540 [Candidatus Neomarinimicrobiota bacterium]